MFQQMMLKEVNRELITNGVIRLNPDDDNNRLLLQVHYYLANNNEVKAREILRTLGLTMQERLKLT